MKVQVQKNPNIGCPEFNDELGRVTVLLGANGAGKSKLISQMSRALAPHFPVKNIVRFKPVSNVGQVMLGPFPLEEKTNQQYNQQKQKSSQNLETFGEVQQGTAIQLLHSRDGTAQRLVVEALRAYHNGDNSPVPTVPKSEIDRVIDIFNDIYDVKLERHSQSGKILCRSPHSPNPYELNLMSSGESWGMRVIPELVARRNDKIIVIVDEPESYLNEQMVSRFWSTIEAKYPDWCFLYATHNPSFAARDSVDKVYLLRSPANSPLPLNDLTDIPLDERQKLFGVAPLLLSTPRTVFVEGKDKSFDRAFYKVIISNKEIDIQPLNSCNDVIKAATHTGYWKYLPFDDINVRGVIDRDYRTDQQLADLKTQSENKLLSLKRHDAEAYIAEPELMARIAAQVSGEQKDSKFYNNILIEYCNVHLIGTIRLLTNNYFTFDKNTLSLGKADAAGKSPDDFVDLYVDKGVKVVEQIEALANPHTIRNKIHEIKNTLEKAINAEDTETLLTYFNGKAVLNEMLPHCGLKNKQQAAAIIGDNSLVDEFPHLAELRQQLDHLF